ncbi:hypothetical protein [Nannocystis sp.]|uniref:hypothetical protein n=1 Tax=Nannocystis sp. TaxID=1962667 RepID=UPI0025F98D22|nr:hypothetical protein [Nannocystis sp.]
MQARPGVRLAHDRGAWRRLQFLGPRGSIGRMRMTSLVPPCLALLALACGPGDGRNETDTPATMPVTVTEASATGTAGTSTGGSSGATPTTSDSGVSGESSGGGTTGQVSASSSGGTTGEGSSSGGGESSGGFKFDLPLPDKPIPVHDIPGLKSITFYETTGKVTEYTFTVDGPELNNQLADPLTQQNRDIQGTGVEFYDVYYSEEDGTFNADGSYLTIAGSFGAKLPAGGGLNLAEISLNYDDNSVEYGSFLASFLGLGDNYVPGTEPNAIDGKLETHTTMGNNVDEPDKRLRVTLGFKSSLMPG